MAREAVISVERVSADDNVQALVDEINAAVWDEANEISVYAADALAAYLERADTVFVVCHEHRDGGRTLLGMASARIEMKPYGRALWLYVDEVDVRADQRRRGAGKALMHKLIEIAEAAGCEEVWLGTEADNSPANALYRALDPDDVAAVVGYTFETDADQA